MRVDSTEHRGPGGRLRVERLEELDKQQQVRAILRSLRQLGHDAVRVHRCRDEDDFVPHRLVPRRRRTRHHHPQVTQLFVLPAGWLRLDIRLNRLASNDMAQLRTVGGADEEAGNAHLGGDQLLLGLLVERVAVLNENEALDAEAQKPHPLVRAGEVQQGDGAIQLNAIQRLQVPFRSMSCIDNLRLEALLREVAWSEQPWMHRLKLQVLAIHGHDCLARLEAGGAEGDLASRMAA